MENEEKIRLDARRRLEEQLKQYRVQRHKDRSHRGNARSRMSSTLDTEVMLNPETLAPGQHGRRDNGVLLHADQRAPGSQAGQPGHPPAKERKSRSPRTSKIHSLADYKFPEDGGGGGGGGGGAGGAQWRVPARHRRGRPSGSLLQQADASPSWTAASRERGPGWIGNDSDSSSYSSVSSRGGYGMLAATGGERHQVAAAAPYMVQGREIAPEAVGQFPSLQEVLQAGQRRAAAAAPPGAGAGAGEGGHGASQPPGTASPAGTPHARPLCLCCVSLESSVMGHDEMLQVLKEKMRLEGQLEALSSEASQALKEKTELQAQLATVNAQLRAELEQGQASQEKQSTLTSEVGTLRQSCGQLERAMAELQGSLESKNASLASLGHRPAGGRGAVPAADGEGGGDAEDGHLQGQHGPGAAPAGGGLQGQLQQVQLERSTLQNRLKTSQAEIDSLQQLRQWYQQQLALAQEARVRLQSEMANMQVGKMTQIGVLEHLKLENVTLSHQLTETQHRSIKEKERIAVQLQSIEVDMMTQESAFQQIQDAKGMVEDDLQHKLDEFEEEREQLVKLANTASALERELEQVKMTLSQKDLQLEALQREHLEVMRQLTAAQESLHDREHSVHQLEARYQEQEAQLAELQADGAAKDDSIQFLQNQKIVLEVALEAARADQSRLDEDAGRLGEDVLVAADVLDQLRQEVQVKAAQIETLHKENGTLKKQAQKFKELYQQQKEQLIAELRSTKQRLAAEVSELRQALLDAQGETRTALAEQGHLRLELQRVQEQMKHLGLFVSHKSVQFDQSQLAAVTEENEGLRKQVEQMQGEAKKAISEQKVRMKRLGTDLTSAQKEVKAKHKAYENAVGILSRRLQEALTEKEAAEAELVKLKAQVSDGANNQALQDKLAALQAELQSVSHNKTLLEKELQEIITLTSTELEEYQEKVMELEDELQEARCFKRRIRKLEDANKKLVLELEHEKGKLAGLGQSHNALREHSNILETALAKREADLVQLNLQVQAVLKRKEEEDQQMKQVVHTLQQGLEKEKARVKDLQEQVAAAKAEAAHNRRHYRAAMLELCEIKKELQAKEELVQALQSEAHKLQAQDEQHSSEVSLFQEELSNAHSKLQILQKQLEEELAKQPITAQEVEDLRWEVEQRQREIEAQKQQMEVTEQCNHRELDNLQLALQSIKVELESVQEELGGARKDKFMLQAKVGELRNSMKTVLLQNQQLKQDLKQSRLRKQRMELKGEGSNASSPVTPVKIPDCPVPASLLDELLKPSASVNKEPLNNLHSCLRQLKVEMDSLQRQMEEHTVTVHESMSSWNTTEDELSRLGVSAPPLDNQEPLESNNSPSEEQEEKEQKVEVAQAQLS
ncbi:hypothetical protein CRUP_011819 [Coryphaenoides rupestris]|nr:hypothetical protein CRUP_011819 [Coryphaenoides rupestris]